MAFIEVVVAALHSLSKALKFEHSALFLYDELADGFVLAATSGNWSHDQRGQFIPAADTQLARVLEEREWQPADLAASDLLALRGVDAGLAPQRALLIPLFDASDIGVVVAASGHPDVVMARDTVSERVRAAAQSIEAARPDLNHWCRFRQILEVDPGGIAVVDGDDAVFSFANAEFRSMVLGHMLPLLGRSLYDALPPDVADALSEALQYVQNSGLAFHEMRLEVMDTFGSRYLDVRLVPEHGRDGTAHACLLLTKDKSGEVAVRRALQDSVGQGADAQSLLTSVLDSTNNGILLVGEDSKILYVNTRLGELFGVNSTALIGTKRSELTEAVARNTVQAEAFVERLTRIYTHLEERVTDEVEIVRPSHRILSRYSGPVYKGDGTLLGKIEVYTDVTDVRELQRNKDEFLSVVSHELKTPITSIKGYAQLLQRRAADTALPASTLAMYGVIERQALRMQELIAGLLDLPRLDTNKLTYDRDTLNFTQLIEHVCELVGMTNEARTITTVLPPDDVWVHGDERRLEQVMTNLLLNAVRYSPGEEIVEVYLSVESDITVLVRDHGIGIPHDALDLVFDRFYRGSGLTDLTGMGIGLYISKTIVQQHGGTISVESEVGVGSSFTVRLPLELLVTRGNTTVG